jgi:hypothetical protein
MSLPYDVARCSGVFFIDVDPFNYIEPCLSCARTDKGRGDNQVYTAPVIKDGVCPNYIKRGIE